MIALSFRTRILLAMMLLVVGATVTTLFITDNQVRSSYERHFQQAFRYQMESFLQQREARLAPIEGRVADAAGSPRLIAAMENAGQPGAEPQDIDDVYQNGVDQLLEGLKADTLGHTNFQSGLFFFFLNAKGETLVPRSAVKLPFVLPDLRRIARQAAEAGQSVLRDEAQQVGYFVLSGESDGARIFEMVFTPIVDQVTRRKLGVLALGFPLPEQERMIVPPQNNSQGDTPSGLEASATNSASPNSSMLSGIWLESQLYSTSIPAGALARLGGEISGKLHAGEPINALVTRIRGVPYQVFYQALNTGPGFPAARQVCLYSLTDAQAENRNLRERILISGTVALLAALGLSLLLSRGLVVPLQELVSGAAEIEHGNYAAKVKVRGGDELGRLAVAFNDMAQQVQASHVAQEQRITERTRELIERKRAEEALRRSEASLREAQRIAHLGNWQWNVQTNELRWSDEIFSIFGLAPEGFDSTHEAFLQRVHPEDRERVRNAVRQALDEDKPYHIDHRIVRPDGEVRIVHERAKVLRDSHGSVQQMFGTVQDITEQKRIEAEFLRAQRLDGIGAIAGGMAHDLNNALSPILMGIQLIRRELTEPAIQQMLTVMEANTYRGADMVRQVLTFARGREGELEILNAGRLVLEMENIARQTLPKSIGVHALVPSDLWPVLGNATQLHQVLLNLCVNARDAMPKGGQLTLAADNVELSSDEAKEIQGATPGPYVMLLVSDTGTGIDPAVLPRIFDAFFTTKGPGKGTGLGLASIARIVRNHGGFISVKSEVGAGTTFEIYLPRGEAAPESAPAPTMPPPELAAGRGELILFIDDDRSVREMVAPALIEQGYRVLSAANGAEALALVGQHDRNINLVLTDVAMPVMDGAEMLTILKARCPDLPVILMSGTLENREGQLPVGATAFLAKPFRLEQLLAVISQALNSRPHDGKD